MDYIMSNKNYLIEKFLNRESLSEYDTLIVLNACCLTDLTKTYIFDEDFSEYILNNIKYLRRDIRAAFFERFEVVEEFGGSRKGSDAWLVVRDIVTNTHYKFDYDYDSYTGFHYESGHWCKVEPVQVIRTNYNVCRVEKQK